MVSFSVGVLLATALLHSLPEAFESGADPRALFGTLLAGLLGFFLLERSRCCATRTTMRATGTTIITATTARRRAAAA